MTDSAHIVYCRRLVVAKKSPNSTTLVTANSQTLSHSWSADVLYL